MLGKWFNSARKLGDERPDVRRQFLQTLSAEKARDLQPELLDALSRESETDNRRLILNHLTDLTPLTALLDGEHGGAYAEYLAGHSERATDAQLAHPQVIRARLAGADDAQARTSLLAQIDDTKQLVELAVSLRGDAQNEVLARLHTEEALQALEHASRHRDKTANRYARERLQQIRTAREGLSAAEERLRNLQQTVQRVASAAAEDPAAREARRTHLVALKREHTGAQSLLQEALVQLTALQQPTPDTALHDPFQGLDLSPPQASPFGEVVSNLPQPTANMTADRIQHALDLAAEQWRTLSDLEAPPDTLAASYQQRTQSLRALHDANRRIQACTWPDAPSLPERISANVWSEVEATKTWLREQQTRIQAIAWPADVQPPPQLLEATAAHDAARARLDALMAQTDAQLANASELVGQARAALEAGESKQAQEHLGSARTLLETLPEQRTRQLNKSMNGLYARLGELKDWQTFATSPKREALLADMQALIDAEVAPDDRAERIKALRGEWNALGKPANKHEYALRQAFDEAAEKAFEPCRAHFAEMNEARRENLAKRQQLVEQLTTYLQTVDWKDADLRAADRIMRTARQEWRAAFPVPRGKDKALNERFEALQNELHNHLKKAWDANADAKRSIITRAEALTGEDAGGATTDAVKALQAEWKSVGPVPRKLDQKLWSAFRQACDAVFEARKQASDDRQAAFEAKRQSAAALCDAFEADGTPPTRKALAEFTDQFAAIGDLGRDGRSLLGRFDALVNGYEAKLADAARRAQVDQLKALQVEDERLAREGGDTTFDAFVGRKAVDNSTEVLHELTIIAEIVAERPSAPEDSAQRMALQVELMNKGGGIATLPSRKELLHRWCNVDGKGTSELVCQLRERFFNALA